MSDTKNRDIGRKRNYKRHARECDCWHCEEAALKRQVKKTRDEQREFLKEVRREMGYARVGANNV